MFLLKRFWTEKIGQQAKLTVVTVHTISLPLSGPHSSREIQSTIRLTDYLHSASSEEHHHFPD